MARDNANGTCLAQTVNRPSGARTPKRRSRGVTLLEMISALAIMAVVTAATVSLYWTGQTAHRRARFYSRGQTNIRTAMRKMTRVTRTSECVVAQGTQGSLANIATNAYQLVLRIPQANGNAFECRYYVSNGVLYQQTSSQSAPGTPLLAGVVSMTFGYYRTAAGVRTSASGSPSTATEVEIAIRARTVSVTTGITTYVTIRTAAAG